MIAVDAGDVPTALRLLLEHARIALELAEPLRLAVSSCRLAAAFVRTDLPALGVQLMASADVVQEDLGSDVPWVAKQNRQTTALAKTQLGDEGFAAAWEAASGVSIEHVTQVAIERGEEVLRAPHQARLAKTGDSHRPASGTGTFLFTDVGGGETRPPTIDRPSRLLARLWRADCGTTTFVRQQDHITPVRGRSREVAAQRECRSRELGPS
ncbi:MAG: hypothetical protein KY456_01100 [Chloroflexi bacterium]|nr:hypothetical protein [Chloroflexota bacterium]